MDYESKKVIEWETISGTPIERAGISIRPQVQVLRIRLPFGGFVWNRPVAVLVEDGGETRRFPITDVTRLAQLALFSMALVIVAAGWLRSK